MSSNCDELTETYDYCEVYEECVQKIVDYLEVLDVLYKLLEYNNKKEYLFTQPGMRYSQAKDLAYALTTSEIFTEKIFSN